MIAFLQGQFVQVTPAKLIVEVGGVGYEVNISLHTYEAISKKEKALFWLVVQGRVFILSRNVFQNSYSLFMTSL